MLISYFSPLAPVIVLLLCAFVLPIVSTFNLRWAGERFIGVCICLTTVGVLLTTQLNQTIITLLDDTVIQQPLRLTIHLHETGWLSILVLLTVLGSCLIAIIPLPTTTSHYYHWAYCFALVAVTILVLLSANTLTLAYALFIFNLVATFFWWQQGDISVGLGRLFLGTFTAISFGLAFTVPNNALLIYLVASVVWLQVVFYPMFEVIYLQIHTARYQAVTPLLYFVATLMVSLYTTQMVIQTPLPLIFQGATLIAILLTGLVIWLFTTTDDTTISQNLIRLISMPPMVLLLVLPIETITLTMLMVGLSLSLTALWLTASMGPLNGGKVWPYLPAMLATLTVLGLPTTLGWQTLTYIYHQLFASQTMLTISLVLIAQGLAFSGLFSYWQATWHGETKQTPFSIGATFIALIPFLLPVGGSYIILAIAQIEGVLLPLQQPINLFVALGITWLIGGGLAYYQTDIISRAPLLPALFYPLATPQGGAYLFRAWDYIGKVMLRVQVVLEGRHYLGWTFLIALMGALIILLDA